MVSSEFCVLMFDGWSTFRNEAVYGFIVSLLDAECKLRTKCVSNFLIMTSHRASNMCSLINKVIQVRLGNLVLDFFARKYMMNDEGDDY